MTNVGENHTTPERKPVRRRALMQGAAWAAPVVSMSVAAPALAASPGSCVAVEDMTATTTSQLSASTPPYNSYVSNSGASAGKTVHQLMYGQDYLIEVTSTYTYTGTVDVPLSELLLRFCGTNSFDWTLVGTPTASSSSGGVELGTIAPTSGQSAAKAWYDVTLAPTGTGDGVLHPGDVITLEWVYEPSIPDGRPDCGQITARAFPTTYFRSCDAWEGPFPTQTDPGYDIYEWVGPECPPVCEASTADVTPTYTRNSKTNGFFSWTNFFDSGDELRLQVVSTAILDNAPSGSGDVITSNNLQWDAPMNADGTTNTEDWGGAGGPENALRISLGNVSYERHLETVFKLVYRAPGTTQFVDAQMSDLGFSIFDIDGGGANAVPYAERIVASTPGGRTSSFRGGSILTGDGSGGAPWRAVQGIQNNENWHPRATVDIQAPGPMNQFSVTFRGDATNANGQTQSNIWVAPFNFTAANPTCT